MTIFVKQYIHFNHSLKILILKNMYQYDPCSIGIHKNQEEECHKQTKIHKKGFIFFKDMQQDELQIFLLRAQIDELNEENGKVRLHHEKLLNQYYPGRFTACCDVFHQHEALRGKKKSKGTHKLI